MRLPAVLRTPARFSPIALQYALEDCMLKRGLMLVVVVALTIAFSPPWTITASASSEDDGHVPAHHAGPPQRGAHLPPILGRDQLWGGNDQFPYQAHAYELAAKIQKVIYQQPCYCYCERMGHKSLHSCFEGTHGAQCSVCLKELYYSYEMTKKHKTAAQIRKGIIAGEWQQVDLASAASIN
jgi:hypothetical protein